MVTRAASFVQKKSKEVTMSNNKQTDIAELAIREYPFSNSERNAFIAGYNKAKENYKYTEEDLAKIFYVGVQLGINQEIAVTSNKPLQDEDAVLKKCIQSLQQPKYPVAFECEIDNILSYNADDGINALLNLNFGNPKTITNSQGLIQVVGKYIY